MLQTSGSLYFAVLKKWASDLLCYFFLRWFCFFWHQDKWSTLMSVICESINSDTIYFFFFACRLVLIFSEHFHLVITQILIQKKMNQLLKPHGPTYRCVIPLLSSLLVRQEMWILQWFCAFVKNKIIAFIIQLSFYTWGGKNVVLFLARINMVECNSSKWPKYYF